MGGMQGWELVGRGAMWEAGDPKAPFHYSDSDVDFLNDVADTILPTTDTPGARDAAVGPFIARYSAACYPPAHIALLKSGISDIDAQMQILQSKGFRQANEAAKSSLLAQIDRQAKEHARLAEAKPAHNSPHYFTLMKQLTLSGFLTSEPGATRVARYRPIPGRDQRCLPYVKSHTFWSW